MNLDAWPLNAMTVDVEDYFQVSAFEEKVARSSWQHTSLRVERNVERILEAFDRHKIKGTFFTLGWIAERCPSMVRAIVSEGHELASHGWDHTRVVNQSAEEFREDVAKTKECLESIGGCSVNGYRAASYSINDATPWAHEVLASEGHHYSSSIAPIRHDLYGVPDAPRFQFDVAQGQIREIPITTIQVLGRNINCAGGGWFRLYPYVFSRWALRNVNKVDGESALFYFHPWEIDPDQPRVSGLSLKTKIRHYLNLSVTENRIDKLLSEFNWGRMDEVFFSANERDLWLGRQSEGLSEAASAS